MSNGGVVSYGGVSWRVLLPDTVETAAGPVALTARCRSVLLTLLLDANHVVSVRQLIEALWGESPLRTACNSIARFVSDLRRALGPLGDRIVTDGRGYLIVVRPGELDWDVARALLLDACAAVVAQLVASTAHVSILATTRVPLGIDDEQVFQLGMLDVPTQGATTLAPAVELFMERAGWPLPQVETVDIRFREIGDICRILGGLPLAIEIAAGQVAFGGTKELLRRLAAPNGDSLAGEAPLAALEGVIEWSWSMLTPTQQALLARMSVFVGGWTSDAAEALSSPHDSVEGDLA